MSRAGSTAVLSPLVALVNRRTDRAIQLSKGIRTRVVPSSGLYCKFNMGFFSPRGLGEKNRFELWGRGQKLVSGSCITQSCHFCYLKTKTKSQHS